MGAGALTGLGVAVEATSDEELRGILRPVPTSQRKKLAMALADAAVTEEGSSELAKGMKFLICGGGNGAHAFAGAAAHRGAHVHVYTPLQEEVDKWKKDFLSITCHYAADGSLTTASPALVTSDPQAAAEGVDIAIVVLPTSFHESALMAVGPHLAKGTAIGTVEGAWWGRPPLGSTLDHLVFFGIDTLPWVARIREYGKSVDINGTKEVWVASSPTDKKKELVSTLERLVGIKFCVGSNLLSLFALDLSLIIHPGLMFGKCSRWDGMPFDEAPLFYHGMDEFTAQIMETMDGEACGVKTTLLAKYPNLDLSDSQPTLQWLHDAYGDKIEDKSTFQSSFTTNASYAGLTFPVKDALDTPGKKVYEFDYRYLTSDVPYGLLVIKGIAELVECPTPTIDAVIVWAQKQIGREWLVDGKVAGRDLDKTRAPQRYGILTLEDFMLGADA